MDDLKSELLWKSKYSGLSLVSAPTSRVRIVLHVNFIASNQCINTAFLHVDPFVSLTRRICGGRNQQARTEKTRRSNVDDHVIQILMFVVWFWMMWRTESFSCWCKQPSKVSMFWAFSASSPVCECSSAALRFLGTRRVHRTSFSHRPNVCSKSQYLRGVKAKRTPKPRISPFWDNRAWAANDDLRDGAPYSLKMQQLSLFIDAATTRSASSVCRPQLTSTKEISHFQHFLQTSTEGLRPK